jgi:hypothetical protein
MIADIRDTDEADFLLHWSERVWDHLQLTHIKELQSKLEEYALTAWRPMNIPPPTDILLITTCDEGVVLMVQNQFHEWRSSDGKPHKPPRAWMPCPPPSPRNGKARS